MTCAIGMPARILAFAEEAAPMYTRRDVRTWLDRSETDHDNLRAAFAWAVERREGEVAQRLSGALWRFWQMRGHLREGREKVEMALAVAGGNARPAELAAHEAAGGLAYWQADMSAAEDHYLAALELAREHGRSPSDRQRHLQRFVPAGGPTGSRRGSLDARRGA